jgi:hypothetical protein
MASADASASDDARDAGAREDPLLEELRAHEHRGPLGALALDVLGRQAEGRTQFVGREHVRKRAADLGVEREKAGTSLCNVLDLLERGAESDRERRVVVSLAVLGLADAVARDEGVAEALVERAVRHATWLEIATELGWLRALASESEGALAQRVIDELAQHVIDRSVGTLHREPRDRAYAVALVAALASARRPRADERLAELARHEGLDPVVAAAVRELSGAGRVSMTAEPVLDGRAAPDTARGARAVLRWITGWAALVGLGRGVARLLGRERRVALSLRGREVDIRESGGLLGRPTTERASSVPVQSLLSVSRERAHTGAALYAGALALAAGVLVGGYLAFDGLRSGELVLASVGAGLVVLGVVADLAADVLARSARGGATVELVLPRGRVVRLVAPSREAADAFLEALRARMR